MKYYKKRKKDSFFMSRKKSFIFFSLGILFLLLFVLPKLTQAQGAVLMLSPQSGTFFVGNTFDVSVIVDTKNQIVNTFDVKMRFSPETLQVVEPFGEKSIITVWASPPSYSNIEGTISFQGGIPQTGIKTSSGLLFKITFRAKSPGKARIIFDKDSKVLLHDGKGTNILGATSGAIYDIVIPPPQGPKVFSPTHPDQDKWYNQNNISLNWEKEWDVTDYSYILTKDPSAIPDNVSEGAQNYVFYEGIEDGLWYFHIKAKKGGNWGGVSTYLIRIDTTPPAEFLIQCDSPRTSNPRPVISFFTTDSASGVDHYEVKIIILSGKEKIDYPFSEEVSPYQLPHLDVGSYDVIVRAFDSAGNWRDARLKIEIIPPGFSLLGKKGILIKGTVFPWWLLILILILILGLIMFLIYRNKKKHKEMKNRVEGSLGLMREIIDNEAMLLAKKLKEGQATRQEVIEQMEVLEDLKRKINEQRFY